MVRKRWIKSQIRSARMSYSWPELRREQDTEALRILEARRVNVLRGHAFRLSMMKIFFGPAELYGGRFARPWGPDCSCDTR